MSIDRRMLLRGALACACCVKAGAAIASDAPAHRGAAPHWSYEGNGSPEKWGDLQADFKVCQLGLEQTPIDLNDGIRGDVGSVDYAFKPLPLRIVNNGHTIQVNADPGSACVIDGTRYELLQFHLHHPSEHLLAGKNFTRMPLCPQVGCRRAGGQRCVRPAGRRECRDEGILRLDARQGRSGSAYRQHDRHRGHPAEDRRLLPLYGFADDPALFGRVDLDRPQGADRGIGRADPEIRGAVFQERPPGSEAQSALPDRRVLNIAYRPLVKGINP